MTKLGRRPYATLGAVQKRVATLLRRHPARRFLEVQVTGGTTEQPLTVTWTRREEVLTDEGQTTICITPRWVI